MTTINPIYNTYFPSNGPAPKDWKSFSDYPSNTSAPDFTEKTYQSAAKTIALLALKIILLPWGLYEIAKALVDRLAMKIVSPAQFIFSKQELISQQRSVKRYLNSNENLIGREVTLEKNGHRYNGLILGQNSTITNGKWAIFAPGNATTIEDSIWDTSPYLQAGYNMLLVNGPGVSKSQGPATVERLGDAQDIALTFLETAIKAKRIVLAGHSLGAAAIGLAASKHTFKPDVSYLAIRIMTFDRLSNIARKLATIIASLFLRLFGCEIDCLSASKKLQQEGVHEIIIQGGQDDLMQNVELLTALQKANLMENKTGIIIPDATHCELPTNRITAEIIKWDRAQDPALAI